MVLAVGTGRALRALPKANRPRGGGVFHRPRQKAIQQAGMAISPCAAGLCSCLYLVCAVRVARPWARRTRRRPSRRRQRIFPDPGSRKSRRTGLGRPHKNLQREDEEIEHFVRGLLSKKIIFEFSHSI